MIITCPSCSKKFEIDSALIPEKGRTLQCGSCSHQWFYKRDQEQEFIEETLKVEPKEEIIEIDKPIKKKEKKIYVSNEDLPVVYKKKLNTSNIIFKIFSYLIVFIISIVAIIIFLDTFKNNLISVFPELELILYNLFESIKDIKLFLIDLIK
ncbi:zinc-ribbon domain-containing protein [Candidatus Pelagibacter sp.]|nr:zinc-ribbon domain-containing protein [Candidatus Pelagibacter sp.]